MNITIRLNNRFTLKVFMGDPRIAHRGLNSKADCRAVRFFVRFRFYQLYICILDGNACDISYSSAFSIAVYFLYDTKQKAIPRAQSAIQEAMVERQPRASDSIAMP